MNNISNKVVTVFVLILLVASFAFFESTKSNQSKIDTLKQAIATSKEETNQLNEQQIVKVKTLPSHYKSMEIAVKNLVTKEKSMQQLSWKDGVYQTNLVKSDTYSQLQNSVKKDFTENVASTDINNPFTNNPKWQAKILKSAETNVSELPVMIAYYNEKTEFVKGVILYYQIASKQFNNLTFIYTEKGNITENEAYFKTPQGKINQGDEQ